MSRRIRSVKPEWLEDERLALVSSDARVMSIALMLLADDEGRGRAGPIMLAGQVFPGLANPREVSAKALEELRAIDFVDLYEADGQHYFEIRNWLKHQKIDHPTPSKLPANPRSSGVLANPRESSREVENVRASRASTPIPSSPDPVPSQEGDMGEEPHPTRLDLAGRPLPRKPLFPEMVQREAYQPSQVMLDYGRGLGLADTDLDGVLRDLRDKHGLRPHTLDWWDERWLRFADHAKTGNSSRSVKPFVYEDEA